MHETRLYEYVWLGTDPPEEKEADTCEKEKSAVLTAHCSLILCVHRKMDLEFTTRRHTHGN